jgi:hypothetical protein
MVAPAAVAAAGWTVEELAAATAIMGTVGGGVKEASAAGGTGWNFDGPEENIHYPLEVGPQLFLGDEHQDSGTLVRFFADGYIWNNECFVYFDGIFSNAQDELLCLANSNHPTVPANRFLEVNFTKGGEELSSGLLRCEVSTYTTGVAGTAEYPAILLQVTGQFDPVGTGGENDFSFTATLDTFAQVTLSKVGRQGNCTIEQAGNQIDVKLDQ